MKLIMEEDNWQLIKTAPEGKFEQVYARYPGTLNPENCNFGTLHPKKRNLNPEKHISERITADTTYVTWFVNKLTWYTLYCNKHKYLTKSYCVGCAKRAPDKLIEALQFLEQMEKI